jgi:UDPglucose 6-dehydrogenase
MARAGELGVADAFSFLRLVDSVNMRQRSRTVEMAVELCDGNVLGRRIAVLGAAFKPDTDDVRDSPALNVAAQLQLRGAAVSIYDPEANEKAAKVFPTLHYVDSVTAAVSSADLVLLLTEWDEFVRLDPTTLTDLVAQPRILDARNALNAEAWRHAGWTYRGFGAGSEPRRPVEGLELQRD